jgi:hypothetical protein
MFLFPLAYLASFFYAVTKLFKKQVDGFLIFIIVGLPIYINAMSVSFMYGFSMWIPLLQSFKELAVLGACLLVATQLKQRPVLHIIDKLIIAFFVYTLLYAFVPIGSFSIMGKLMALKNLSFFCLLYFIGRFCDKDQVNINKLFSFIVIVLLVATIVVFGERVFNQHLHSFTGFSDYNFYFFNTDASGNYGLLWTFETESSAKRFGSIFSNPLEFASAIVLSLGIMFALISSKNNTEPNAIIQTNPNTLEKIGLIASFICIVLALSRAAFISYFLVIYIYGWIIENKKIIHFFHIGAAIIVLYVFYILEGDLYDFIMNTITFQNESSLGHVLEWLDGINAMATQPWGLGLGESGRVSMTNKNNTGGENQFIIIGVQVGVIAMALYIYIYFKLIKTGLQQLKITAGKEWKIMLAIVLIKIGMFIPMFTAYIDSYIYLSYFSWFLSGYMINHIQNRQLIAA